MAWRPRKRTIENHMASPVIGTKHGCRTKRAAQMVATFIMAISVPLLLMSSFPHDKYAIDVDVSTETPRETDRRFPSQNTTYIAAHETQAEYKAEDKAEDKSKSESQKNSSPSEDTKFIPPTKMKILYNEMWNHSTSTVDIPEEYKSPFDEWVIDDKGQRRRPLTSLEILQEVLHGTKYRADFEALEDFLEYAAEKKKAKEEGKQQIPKVDPPRCMVPDTQSTRELANKVVEARHQQQKQPTRKPTSQTDEWQWPHHDLVLPLPVINVGFPKSGSTTLYDYFNCIGLQADHSKQTRVCFTKIIQSGNLKARNPLRYHAYCQIDHPMNDWEGGYFPQISLLDELHELHPTSTLVFLHRPVLDWMKSVENFKGMRRQFAMSKVPGLQMGPQQLERVDAIRAERNSNTTTPIELTDLQLAKWWCGHVLHIREYVREYPSHALVELNLYDSDETSSILYDLFQVDTDAHFAAVDGSVKESQPKRCWGHNNEGNKGAGSSTGRYRKQSKKTKKTKDKCSNF